MTFFYTLAVVTQHPLEKIQIVADLDLQSLLYSQMANDGKLAVFAENVFQIIFLFWKKILVMNSIPSGIFLESVTPGAPGKSLFELPFLFQNY